MKLIELIPKRQVVFFHCSLSVEISSLACKLEDVKAGSLFFCFEGSQTDSHLLTGEAKKRGAVCFICERHIEEESYLVVKNSRKAMSLIAKTFYQNAADKLSIITVVGTNGKTTTSHIIESIFFLAGYKTGLIGTCGIKMQGEWQPLSMTTPDPIDLHKIFFDMVSSGIEVVIMEASAHSLYLNKMCGIYAKAAVFTNFSQDHLDFFKTIASYKKSKTKYFCEENMAFAVINADDEVGREIMQTSGLPVVTYACSQKADISCLNISTTLQGSEFVLCNGDALQNVHFSIPGTFNVYNCMAAFAVSLKFGIDSEIIAKGIDRLKSVDGRFNILRASSGYSVVIDYAHTPDGMEKVLQEGRRLTASKLVTVFGCGGNRDSSKRRIMGEIASKLSDLVVITSDNPRQENPQDIMTDIQRGIDTDCFYLAIENREKAIEYALQFAGSGDVVMVLGKGHETYQEISGIKYHFSDMETVKKYMP